MKERSDWDKEYQLLLESPRTSPPRELNTRLKKFAHDDLNPPAWKVFCKLFAIHFVAGTVTLFFCPQLGFSIHPRETSLFSFLLKLGEFPCTVLCGAIFLGATGLVAALLLRSPEIRAIKKTRALQWALLSFLSLGFFLSLKEAETHIPLGLAAIWVLSALVGGFFSFQLGWLVRGKIKAHFLR